MKTDVVVLTKNSQRVLEKCFNSIYKNVPVNHLIVVDGCSTDKTLEIVDKFSRKHRNVVLIKDQGTRGSARQKGIEAVETELFMFVDSDVVLCHRWFEKAEKFMEDDVGAVWGIEVWSVVRSPAFLKLFLQVTRKIFEIRGGTHDLLVRREAVEGIQIPRELHYFEDTYIKEWINKNGYKVIAKYNPYCIHYRPPTVWSIKGSIDLSSEAIMFGLLEKYPKLLLPYSFYTTYVIYRSLLLKRKNVFHS
ncbi:MAG: glycosyltransferase family A protein [Thermoproteota archaeon]|nr:glycosyltransferase family A protein [Thermoproteota archaeon]